MVDPSEIHPGWVIFFWGSGTVYSEYYSISIGQRVSARFCFGTSQLGCSIIKISEASELLMPTHLNLPSLKLTAILHLKIDGLKMKCPSG